MVRRTKKSSYIPHWPNPWHVIYIPIEELVDVALGIGERCRDVDDSIFIMTRERMLEHWRRSGDALDAYILPQQSGWHCMGIRYGSAPSQYLSPACDQVKAEALLRKYR